MKRTDKSSAALILSVLISFVSLSGCTDTAKETAYGDYLLDYSDGNIIVHYEPSTENKENYESESEHIKDYDADKVIDLFKDVEDWFVFSGDDGSGKVEIVIPSDYSREVDGYYFKFGGDRYHPILYVIYDNELKGSILYGISRDGKHSDFSEGDNFTVMAFYSDKDYPAVQNTFNDLFSQTGNVVLQETKEYEFPYIGSYINEIGEFKDEYITAALDYINELGAEGKIGYSGSKYYVNQLFLCSIKPGEILSDKSKVMLAAGVVEDGIDVNYGWHDYMVYLKDLKIEPNGGITIEKYDSKKIYGDVFPYEEHLYSYFGTRYEYTDLNID
ncbi:MAG: hypothetical protein ACI4XJ_07710 [Eubacteriales bacterium]